MNLEFFIARRIAAASGSDSRNVMERIATLTVAVGMAVMIVALAVISGFRREITERMIGFGAHVQIVNLDNNNSLETVPIRLDPALEAQVAGIEGFRAMAPYAVKGGIVRTDEAIEGVMLKGVDGSYDWSFFARNLIEGALPRVGDTLRRKEVLLSRSLASMLRLGVGDRMEMLFVGERGTRRDRFKVSGLYATGMVEMDRVTVMGDIRDVQRLSGWERDQVSGYEVDACDADRLEEFAAAVAEATMRRSLEQGTQLMASSIGERYPAIFDWLRAHDVNAAVIVVIMLTVALLNMVSALLILLLERTRMIGVLKALGMRARSIRRIFLYRSLFIVLKGLLWGNAVALALCLVQLWWHPLRLDPAGYFISEVPVELQWGWWLGLNAGTVVVLLALLTLPSLVVTFIKPDTAIRYRP